MSNYQKASPLSMKALRKFIIDHPEGVTIYQIRQAGISVWGLDCLRSMGAIEGTQIRKPEADNPRAYHWLWKATPIQNPKGE